MCDLVYILNDIVTVFHRVNIYVMSTHTSSIVSRDYLRLPRGISCVCYLFIYSLIV